MSNVFFGIDIGTGNCSVAYVVDDPRQRGQHIVDVRTVSVAVDDSEVGESNRLPSIVSTDWITGTSTRKLFGWEFQRGFFKKRRSAKLLRRGVDYFSSVKSDMGTNKVYPRSALSGLHTPLDVTTFILERLAEAVTARDPKHNLKRSFVAVTVPASFSSLARNETLEALEKAGFDTTRVELIDEPVAALLDLLNSPDAAAVLSEEFRNVLVFDYGAGTCDLSLVKARFNASAASGLEVVNLAISPYRKLGGDDIDRAVMEKVVWPQIADEQQRATISTAEERRVEDTLTGTVARGLKERMCRKMSGILRDGRDPKVMASKTVYETYALECRFAIDSLHAQTPAQFKMTAEQFSGVMEPFLCSLFKPILDTLERAELKTHQLDVVVLHGGSSQNPYVETMLRERIGGRRDLFGSVEVVSTPERLASVARGAALAAYWRHARNVEIVAPIIADDLGLVVIDGTAKCLLRAGHRLPYPNEDAIEEVTASGEEFVVPTDSLPDLLIPIYTGRAETPSIAGTIKVRIAPATPEGAPVKIKLNITRDKILNWWFSVNDQPFEKAESVNDPWTTKALSFPERQLTEHRRAMRTALDREGSVSAGLLIQEALYLRTAGHHDEAMTALDDILEVDADFPDALNLKGLLCHDLGRKESAVQWFRLAAEVDGTDAILVGNYGAQLVEMGNTSEAIAAMRRALSMDSSLTYIYEYLAQALRREGNEEAAQRELRRGITVAQHQIDNAPFDPEAWVKMHSLRTMLGEYEQADAALKSARELARNQFYGGDSSAIIASRFGRKTWQDEKD